MTSPDAPDLPRLRVDHPGASEGARGHGALPAPGVRQSLESLPAWPARRRRARAGAGPGGRDLGQPRGRGRLHRRRFRERQPRAEGRGPGHAEATASRHHDDRAQRGAWRGPRPPGALGLQRDVRAGGRARHRRSGRGHRGHQARHMSRQRDARQQRDRHDPAGRRDRASVPGAGRPDPHGRRSGRGLARSERRPARDRLALAVRSQGLRAQGRGRALCSARHSAGPLDPRGQSGRAAPSRAPRTSRASSGAVSRSSWSSSIARRPALASPRCAIT